MPINVVGPTQTDVIIELPAWLKRRAAQTNSIELSLGQNIAATNHLTVGGSGANIAAGLAKLGFSVSLLTDLGTDYLSRHSQGELVRQQITILNHEKPTDLPVEVVLSAEGRRTVLAEPLSFSPVARLLPEVGHLHICPLQGETKQFYQDMTAWQVKTGQSLSLNPSSQTIQERDREFMTLLKTTTILILNSTEAQFLSRLPTSSPVAEQLKTIHRFGPKVVCLTLGDKGATVSSDQTTLAASSLTRGIDALDPTGAGDAFISGFLAGYLQGEKDSEADQLTNSLRFAIANSGSVVTRFGAQTGLLTHGQLAREASLVKVRAV